MADLIDQFRLENQMEYVNSPQYSPNVWSSSRLKMTAVSNDGKPLRHCKKNSEKAEAFSHFSLEDSARKWIAIDLQGVGETWIDPVIGTGSTIDPDCRLFCPANCVKGAINTFIKRHICNDFCKN